MYQIKCDGNTLFDTRDEDYLVLNPHCHLEVNTVGEGSFVILPNHPFYASLKKLKSIFEIIQDNTVIFRGRMMDSSHEFYNQFHVDLEGVLGFTNGSVIPPFNFPEDFTIPDGSNVVEVLLNFFLTKHNEQVQDWQKLKLGTVTVTDPNNVITRSSESYLSTWECLKTKLFDSSLGGYLCARYEVDGNYIDYLADFELTNIQHINLGENMLDISAESDGHETYTVVCPFGAESDSKRLSIAGLVDGNVTPDFVKQGNFLYSVSGVQEYGWIVAPISETTWDDVHIDTILLSKAVSFLGGNMVFINTKEIKAVDLHYSDEEIQSFRIYRNIIVNSPYHGISEELFQLTALDIDLMKPQNTVITVGKKTSTLTDITTGNNSELIERLENAAGLVEGFQEAVTDIENVKTQVQTLQTEFVSTCESIIFNAMEDYVRTGDYEDFRQTVSSQLQIMADNISLNFTTTTNSIQNIDGDMQNRFEQLSKYIKFSGDTAITLGTAEDEITLEFDPVTGIIFKKNGVQFGWWDGVDFHTGNIVVDVNERVQFDSFAFIPRSDRSLMFLKVAGTTEDTSDDDEEFIPVPDSELPDTPQDVFTYSVNQVEGASYGFNLNSNGYYESTNKLIGANNTSAICRINFHAPTNQVIRIWVINYAEQNYDYGMIGNIDTILPLSTTVDTSQVMWFGKDTTQHSATEIAHEITIPSGEHFIDMKYVKDSSQDSNNDSLQFRIEVVS